MNKKVLLSRLYVIVFSVGLTMLFIFLLIPSFPKKEKINELLLKINEYEMDLP